MNFEAEPKETDEQPLRRPLSPASRAHLQTFAGRFPGMTEFLAESDALQPGSDPFTPDTE